MIIRKIVAKDCIEIWQSATIRDALPEEYKENLKQEQGIEGNKANQGSRSEQPSEFAPFGENGGIHRDIPPYNHG